MFTCFEACLTSTAISLGTQEAVPGCTWCSVRGVQYVRALSGCQGLRAGTWALGGGEEVEVEQGDTEHGEW